MHVSDSSLPFEDGYRYEVTLTNRDLASAHYLGIPMRPSASALPSEWLRWLLAIAEARGH